MKHILLILIFFSFCCEAFSQNNYIDSIKTHYRIVGITYAVFNSTQILELGAFGKRRVDDTALVLTTDKFHIGSNTDGNCVAFDNYSSQKVLEKCGFIKIGEEKGFANARQTEIEEYIYKLSG